MTAEELREMCEGSLTVSFADSARALGLGLTCARAAYARGDYPLRVVRCGRALRVPSADLAALLLGSDNDEAVAPHHGHATTTDEREPRHVHSIPA